MFFYVIMKGNTRNPFIITPFVPEEYFCDRKTETEMLCKHILNGRNVALFAKRRLGKTGLIRHCFEQPQIKDNYNTFLIDIYSATSLKEMATLFAREVLAKSSIYGLKEKILNNLRSLRPSLEYNELTATFSFSLIGMEVKSPERTMEEVLSILDAMDKPAVIAIDEFQSIRNFKESNVEAYLRTLMQNCRNITFIYTGSISHAMNNMFKSADKPFYNSAVMMTIDVIPKDVYREFAVRMFRNCSRDIAPELVDKCYNYFGGMTWYVQLMMNEAFAQTDKGERLENDSFEMIYYAIIAQQSFSYEEQFSRFSEKQKQLLLALSSEDAGGVSITSEAFLSKYGLGSASSVQTAGNALKKLNIISDANDKKKIINDLIFRDWLRNRM